MTTGSRNKNTGLRTIWDEEILERLEKPVGTVFEHRYRVKIVGSNPAGPTIKETKDFSSAPSILGVLTFMS